MSLLLFQLQYVIHISHDFIPIIFQADSETSLNITFDVSNSDGMLESETVTQSTTTVMDTQQNIGIDSQSSSRKTPNHRQTIDDDAGSGSSKRVRKEDSNSSIGDYRELFTETLLKQSENHQMQSELMELHKEKIQIGIQMSKIELDKANLDLETARELAKIEIHKQKQLAELEIERLRRNLDK